MTSNFTSMPSSCLAFAVLMASLLSACGPEGSTTARHRVFRFEFTSPMATVGPTDPAGSGFVCLVDSGLLPVFLSAHHVVAGYLPDDSTAWKKIQTTLRNETIRSVTDPGFERVVGPNIPISGARSFSTPFYGRTGKSVGHVPGPIQIVDIAAYYVPDTTAIDVLRLAGTTPAFGDTVFQIARMRQADRFPDLVRKAVVVLSNDSLLMFEWTDTSFAGQDLHGTSGSPILNARNEVVSLTAGGWKASPDEVSGFIQAHRAIPHRVRPGRLMGMGPAAPLMRQKLRTSMALPSSGEVSRSEIRADD